MKHKLGTQIKSKRAAPGRTTNWVVFSFFVLFGFFFWHVCVCVIFIFFFCLFVCLFLHVLLFFCYLFPSFLFWLLVV